MSDKSAAVASNVLMATIAYVIVLLVVIAVKISNFIHGKDQPWHGRSHYLLHQTGPFVSHNLWPFLSQWWVWGPFAFIALFLLLEFFGPVKVTGGSSAGGWQWSRKGL